MFLFQQQTVHDVKMFFVFINKQTFFAFHVKCQTNFLKLERTFFLGQLYKLQKGRKGYQ